MEKNKVILEVSFEEDVSNKARNEILEAFDNFVEGISHYMPQGRFILTKKD